MPRHAASSLGRIYDDLGFRAARHQRGGQSLALDPASPRAHRFLSDLYFGVPRLEIARASELLQAQLLQDPSLQPLQPSLPFTDLDLVADAGPRTAGFNEYDPLFVGNGIRVDAAGTVGSHTTAAGEAAISTLVGRTALSAGIFHYQSDGFRRNFDVEHDVENIFAQSMLGDNFSIQGEYRHRDTHGGDRRLLFDIDEFERSQRRDLEEGVHRLGARYSLSSATDFLFSYIQANQRLDADFEFIPGIKQRDDQDVDTSQAEVQFLELASKQYA